MFQESGDASSDNKQQLIGHWRKTTIVFESPKDEYLVLQADEYRGELGRNCRQPERTRHGPPERGRQNAHAVVRRKPELATVHLLQGPTRFSKYSETPWLLGKDRIGGMKATKLVCIGAVCFAAASVVTSHGDSDKSVTAAQVKTKDGEFKICALGKQRLQVEFSGVYEYKTPRGPNSNEGDGSGIAIIEGDTAIFKPEGAERECRSR